MKNPKANEEWIVDLSPTRGSELGGVRKCLVNKKINNNLYRVIPYGFGFESAEEELVYEHTRTIDISRFKKRCL